MLNFIFLATTASITKTASLLNRLLNRLQAKQFVSMILVVFVLLTTNIKQDTGNPVTNLYNKIIHQVDSQDGSQRPKTTGQWNKQARETEGKPGEKLKRIGEQSADAVKDMGSVYIDTAKRSADSLKNN